MTSLLNVMIAKDVAKLFEHGAVESDMPDDRRSMPRAQAEAIIHAALWAYACRDDSTAGCYARMAMFDAIGLESWKFKKGSAEGEHRASQMRVELIARRQEESK